MDVPGSLRHAWPEGGLLRPARYLGAGPCALQSCWPYAHMGCSRSGRPEGVPAGALAGRGLSVVQAWYMWCQLASVPAPMDVLKATYLPYMLAFIYILYSLYIV